MKRQAFKVLLVLLASAIINVAVTWAFALWGSYERTPEHFYSHPDKNRWICDIDYGIGVTRTAFIPDGQYWQMTDLEVRPQEGFDLPYWSRLRVRPTAGIIEDSTAPWYSEHAYGWPFRSAVAELCNKKPKRSWYIRSGIQVLGGTGGYPYHFRVLPINPLWPGFLINTSFYATIHCVLFALVVKLRRWLRLKRGQCGSCGYLLRGGQGNLCPECGASDSTLSSKHVIEK
jgi:hypothetical protein